MRRDSRGAARELELAERLDPDALNVLQGRFFFHMTCGWPPERMLDYTRRLAEVHPLNPYAAQLHGIAYWHLHDFETALREFDRLLEQYPDYYPIRWSRYMTLNELGRDAEALEEAKRAVALYDYGDVRSFLGVAYARVGDHRMARKIYADLVSRPGKYWAPWLRGVLLLELGERDLALDAFEQSYRDHDWGLPPAMHYKMLARLHGNPRFERLVDLLDQRPRYERLVRLLDS
jgi:tetratricopeptide (TPR) repeat protein